jgi:DNA-binding NarL/FixJ family response regulator
MLVDDHNLIREGIRQLLEFNDDMRVICESSNGQECLEMLQNIQIDILLLDINMPGMNGIDTLAEIRRRKIPTKVLMLTVHNEVEYLVRATDIGVEGYILKDAGFDELKTAIYSIMNGENYIQPKLIPSLNNYLVHKDMEVDKIKSLTRREMDVLKLMAVGGFNKDIAAKLNISERTVKNHISNIFKKIEVTDRTQAAVFAIKNNLVSI